MADIKILKANGVEVHPVTHEDAVVNNLGLSVGFTYQAKSDTYLSTTAKTIVGGINEINAKKVLREADQGTVTGTNTSVKIISLKCGGARFYPVCHSDYVLHTDGKSLQSNINTLKTNNTNITNRVSTLESTFTTIQTNNTSSNTKINTVSTTVGKISDLQTSAKSNLVVAINEINQFGSNLRNRLRTALSAKGISPTTTPIEDASIDEMITLIESEDVGYELITDPSYTVEDIPGSAYNFTLNSNGRWVSQNKTYHNTAANCLVRFNNPRQQTIRLHYRCFAESSCDYGLVAPVNTMAGLGYNEVASNSKSLSTNSGTFSYVDLGTYKSGFFHIKYIKDGSVSSNEDNLRFYITFV